MTRLYGTIDPKKYKRWRKEDLSQYKQQDRRNYATHFKLTAQEDGFDKVDYYVEV